jgi:hypothetical protein
MNTSYYQKDFKCYDDAFEFMQFKNKSFEKSGNSVVYDKTAIELGLGYVISYGNSWICNPFL